jgi:hypothetical protein
MGDQWQDQAYGERKSELNLYISGARLQLSTQRALGTDRVRCD